MRRIRSYASADLVDLPQSDAATAIALASALDAAAEQQASLPTTVKDARAEMVADAASLLAALETAPPPEKILRAIDAREDSAVGALYDTCRAFARLQGEIPEGDIARGLIDRVFPDGIAFVKEKARKEWSVVEGKLKVIDEEQLESQFAQLGALPILAHLRQVHIQYGEATGMTKPIEMPEAAAVGEHRRALLESIKHYVVAVSGSVRRKVPATQKLADELLAPLVQWLPDSNAAPKLDGKSAGPSGES